MIDKINNFFTQYEKDRDSIIKNYSFEERTNIFKYIENMEFEDYEQIKFFKSFQNRALEPIFFTPDEAINNLIDKDYFGTFLDFALSYSLDDKGRVKLLENYGTRLGHLINVIVLGISSSSIKVNYIKKYKDVIDEYYLFQILKSLPDNQKKQFVDSQLKSNILFSMIDSIHDIDTKVELFVQSYHKFMHDLKYRNAIIKYLNKIDEPEKLKKIVGNILKNKNISSNECGDLIIKLSNDDVKIWTVKKIKNLSIIYQIVASLKSDKLKLDFLDTLILKKNDTITIIDESIFCIFVQTLLDDNNKISLCIKYKKSLNIFNFISLVSSINDDNIKLNYLKTSNLTEHTFVEIAKTIKDDKIKLSLATEYKSTLEGNQYVSLLESIKSDVIKKEIAENLDLSIMIKQRIICSIKDVKIHLNTLTKFSIENKLFGTLHEYVMHNDQLLKYEDIDYNIVKFYSEQLNLNYENLKILVDKYKYIILRYTQNQNMVNIINSDKKIFKDFLMLFSSKKSLKLNESNIDSIYDLLIQRIFRNNNPNNILNLFTHLTNCIQVNNKHEIARILKNINDSGLVNLKKDGIIIEELVEKLLNRDTRESSLILLKKIVYQYIIKSRNKYFSERKRKIYTDLNLKIKYEKKYVVDCLLKKLNIGELVVLFSRLESNSKLALNDECKALLVDRNRLIKCLEFKKEPELYSGDVNLIKSSLKHVNEMFDILYVLCYDVIESEVDITTNKSNFSLDINNIDNQNIVKIMSEIDINQLKEKLFNNEQLYQDLLKILHKYKLFGWGNIFDKVLKEANIEFGDTVIANMIMYFYKFYPNLLEKSKKSGVNSVSLVNLIDVASVYGSSPLVYKILLGKEDYDLIAINPPNNAASMSKEERFKRIPENIKKLFDRKYITVPPINEEIQVSETKKLKVVIGNTTDTINLTYGERTGTCMRIGGAGSTLFDFCLENENGFHVMITDPETNNLVSRVSGYRNGNSVFLNQLRYSLNSLYSNRDLVELIKIVSKRIVEMSKNSKYPIDNVFISNDCVMKHVYMDTIELKEDIKQGYNYFYTDISRFDAILLASSNNDVLVDVLLDPNKVQKYDVLRKDIICITDKKEIINNIIRQHLISNLIDGKSIEQFDITKINISLEIVKLYVGEDWYIALNNNNDIIKEFYMNRSVFKAIEEMNNVKKEIICNLKSKSKKIGGLI